MSCTQRTYTTATPKAPATPPSRLWITPGAHGQRAGVVDSKEFSAEMSAAAAPESVAVGAGAWQVGPRRRPWTSRATSTAPGRRLAWHVGPMTALPFGAPKGQDSSAQGNALGKPVGRLMQAAGLPESQGCGPYSTRLLTGRKPGVVDRARAQGC